MPDDELPATDPRGPARAGRPRVAPFIVLAVALVIGALFVLLASGETRKNAFDPRTPLMGKPAPAMVGETLDGTGFDLADYRGRVVLLNFFQSSCGPCKAEHADLVRFAAEQEALPDGAQLVSVVFNDRRDKVQEFFVERGGGDWPVVFERGLSAEFGVARVPETWVIDQRGVVVRRIISQTTRDCLTAVVGEVQTGEPMDPRWCQA